MNCISINGKIINLNFVQSVELDIRDLGYKRGTRGWVAITFQNGKEIGFGMLSAGEAAGILEKLKKEMKAKELIEENLK